MTESASASEAVPHGEATVWLGAAVLDVGLAGVAIESETRLPPEQPLVVRFERDGDAIALDGRVVWCFFHGTDSAPSGEQRPVYRAGVEFADVLTPNAERLVGYLEAETATPGESRIFGRFRPATGQAIRLAARAPFRCEEMSEATVTALLRLGFEPAADARVELLPRGAQLALSGVVRSAERSASPERWRVVLDVGGADPRALVALRKVAYN